MRSPIRGVLFDVDGTLCNSIPVIIEVFDQIYRTFQGKTLSSEEIQKKFGPGESQIFAKDFGVMGQRITQEYVRRYSQSISSAAIPDGLIAFLDWARAAEIKLGIVTNKEQPSTEVTLAQLDLLRRFDPVITADQVARPKPYPDGMQKALSAWDLPAHAVIMVGDSANDVLAAQAAGVQSVAVTWFNAIGLEMPGAIVVHSLAELSRIIYSEWSVNAGKRI